MGDVRLARRGGDEAAGRVRRRLERRLRRSRHHLLLPDPLLGRPALRRKSRRSRHRSRAPPIQPVGKELAASKPLWQTQSPTF